MPFTKYGAANLAQGQLQGGVSASSPSGILQSGQGALFPTNAECPFWAKIEKFDTALNGYRVLKREIVKVTGRSGDALTWTRSAGYCPFDYQATTQTNTAAAFDAGDTITQIFSAEQIREIQDGKLSLESYQNQSPVYAADVGTANTYSITLTPAPTAYATGQRFSFKALNGNTGTSTLNVNGLGAIQIKKIGGTTDLGSGDITANQIVDVVYDGTNFEMQTPVPPAIPTRSFRLGESCAQGDALALEKYTHPLACDSQITQGNGAAATKVAFRVMGNGQSMNSIFAGLKKVGNPLDNLVIAIQADTAGAPSGTDLATATIAGTSLTTTTAQYNPTLSGSITPSDGVWYWVEFRRSSANDTSNYYQIAAHTDDTIAYPYKIHNGTSYGSNTLTETHSIFAAGFQQEIAVRARATLWKFSKIKAYAPAALSAGASVSQTIDNQYTGLSGLQNGKPYYLSDTAGAISLTAGTIKTSAGVAQSSSKILLNNGKTELVLSSSVAYNQTGTAYSNPYFVEEDGVCMLQASGSSGFNAGGTGYLQWSTDLVTWNTYGPSSGSAGSTWTGPWATVGFRGGLWLRSRMDTSQSGGTVNCYINT